jgi:hypothetical protein
VGVSPMMRMNLNNEILTLINRRRRQILVHSYLYYRLNTNLIDDHTYDAWSKELAELQRKYPEESSAGIYARDFADYDGSSGFDLPLGEPWIHSVAAMLIKRKGER